MSPTTSAWFRYKLEATTVPSSVLINLLKWLINLGKTSLTFACLLKATIRDTEEQTDEEMLKGVWVGPEHRSVCLHSAGCILLLSHGCIHHLQTLWPLATGGFLIRHDLPWALCPVPLSSLEDRDGAENLRLPIMAWSLWWATLNQGPTQHHLTGTEDAPGILITRVIGALCQEQGMETYLVSIISQWWWRK